MLGPNKQRRYPVHRRQLVVVALLGGAMAIFSTEFFWAVVGAFAALIVLGISVWVEFVAPAIRRRRLAKPCEVHFTLRSLAEFDLGYVLQDDERHHVAELVVPSHTKSLPIEIGFFVVVPLHVHEMVFGCEGDAAKKPFATGRKEQFKKRQKPLPRNDYIDVNNFYHAWISRALPVGTHFVTGLELTTRDAGVYPVTVSFITDEIEGNAKLQIRVEDHPETVMICSIHNYCRLRPTRSTSGGV